jgi:hypothetical protein
MYSDRTALLIIRAWLEGESLDPLRARVRLTTDVSTGFEQELTLTDVKAVSSAVETWLKDVLASSRVPTEETPVPGEA